MPCEKCPVEQECGILNANLKRDSTIPQNTTFCPLKFAIEWVGELLKGIAVEEGCPVKFAAQRAGELFKDK